MKIERLTKTLKRRVRQGEWLAKDTLPSRSLLSEEYGVSPASVSIAIRNLEKEGLVRIVPRKGVFVVEAKPSATAPGAVTIGLYGGYVPSQEELLAMEARQLFSKALFNGIWETANQENCPLLLLPSSSNTPPLTVSGCTEAGVQGVIFMGGDAYPDALELRRAGFPVILSNRPVGSTPLNFVDYDARRELREIIGRFVAHGHRNIGVLCPDRTSVPGYYARLKLDFIDALLDFDIYLNPKYYWKTVNSGAEDCGGQTIESIVEEWLAQPEPPTAVFCWSPDIARRFEKEFLSRLGQSTLEISLACSGYTSERDVEFSGFVMPHLECGSLLLSSLHSMIDDPFFMIQRLIACRFVDRGSIKPI